MTTKEKMSQFRNLFVEFSGDPSNDKELYKRYCSSEKFEPLSLSDEVIHFVEIAALEAAQKEIEKLTAALKVAEKTLEDLADGDYDSDFGWGGYAARALSQIQKIKKGLG